MINDITQEFEFIFGDRKLPVPLPAPGMFEAKAEAMLKDVEHLTPREMLTVTRYRFDVAVGTLGRNPSAKAYSALSACMSALQHLSNSGVR